MLSIVKNVLRRMLDMCEPAYSVLRGMLLLSCTLVGCSLIILLWIGDVTIYTYELYLCALEMARAPAAMLLLAAIGTVCIEDIVSE